MSEIKTYEAWELHRDDVVVLYSDHCAVVEALVIDRDTFKSMLEDAEARVLRVQAERDEAREQAEYFRTSCNAMTDRLSGEISKIATNEIIISEMQEMIAHLISFVPGVLERKNYFNWLDGRRK